MKNQFEPKFAMSDGNKQMLAIENAAGEPVGRILFRIGNRRDSDNKKKFVEFISVVVDEEQQGKGIGTKLLDALKKKTLELDGDVIYVMVSSHNKLFKEFLIKNKFSPEKEIWIHQCQQQRK